MRVLVTGAGGLVGSEVGSHLARHDVAALPRAALDLTDRDSVEQAVGAVGPEAVINCAAFTDVDACEADPERALAVNALGVRHLALACTRADAHLVHISTDYVFSGDKDGPYDEWDAPAPLSVYGRSKLGGEVEAAAHASSWAVVRTSWIFGPRRPTFVDAILQRARPGERLRVVTDQQASPTYAPDLAAVLARLAVERRRGIYHVTNQGSATRFELARVALELAGLDPAAVEPATSAEMPRPARRPVYSVLANTALASTGLPLLRHWREALAEKLEGYVRGTSR